MSDFDGIWPILNLERTVGQLTSEGQLAAADAAAWRDGIASVAAAGTLCLEISNGLCVARKC